MIKIERDVQNQDGSTARVTVIYSRDGVSVTRVKQDKLEAILFTVQEADALIELFNFAEPAYRRETDPDF